MAKELYLYTNIYDFVAQDLVSSMELNMDTDISLRANSTGGSVFAMHCVATKMTEHGNVSIKVDGVAMSAMAQLLLFASRVECTDVAKFMIHRADMYISSPEDQKFLNDVNKDLKAKFLLKVDQEKFKEVTGYTVNDMFDPTKRIDIFLTAKQAKKIGLVDKINTLTPIEVMAFTERFKIVAEHTPIQTQPVQEQPIHKIEKPIIKMDKITLKAQHPDVYASIVAEATTDAVKAERDRVAAWMEFNTIDPEEVAKGVASGEAPSMKTMSAFVIKMGSKTQVANITADASKDIKLPEAGAVGATPADQIAKDKALADFRKAAGSITAQHGVKL